MVDSPVSRSNCTLAANPKHLEHPVIAGIKQDLSARQPPFAKIPLIDQHSIRRRFTSHPFKDDHSLLWRRQSSNGCENLPIDALVIDNWDTQQEGQGKDFAYQFCQKCRGEFRLQFAFKQKTENNIQTNTKMMIVLSVSPIWFGHR
ncbi:hypothetical protein [Ruegeria conchae]|uniref:hypothetical protein n=1 Tax=Ruegeria conchae TaxID=981384 RepID=UPI0002379659|nr:hypothetical protein [Ruegeria conchae]